MQERVGDPAELESGESVVAPDSDDQQVGVVQASSRTRRTLPSAVLRRSSTIGCSAAASLSADSRISAARCSCRRAGSPASRGSSVLSYAGQRHARTESRAALRTSASSKANRVAAVPCGPSPTPRTTRRCVPALAWLSRLPRNTITGQAARPATVRLTEPSSSSVRPLRPRDPTTSAAAVCASFSSTLTASSGRTSVVTFTSGARRWARCAAASMTLSAITCSGDLSRPSTSAAPS